MFKIKNFRKYKIYLVTNVLPEIEDQGLAVGRPPYIVNTNLKSLNQDIETTIGYADNIAILIENVVQVRGGINTECGNVISAKILVWRQVDFIKY